MKRSSALPDKLLISLVRHSSKKELLTVSTPPHYRGRKESKLRRVESRIAPIILRLQLSRLSLESEPKKQSFKKKDTRSLQDSHRRLRGEEKIFSKLAGNLEPLSIIINQKQLVGDMVKQENPRVLPHFSPTCLCALTLMLGRSIQLKTRHISVNKQKV